MKSVQFNCGMTMRKAVVALAGTFSAAFAQNASWNATTSTLSTTPASAKVGIGVSAPATIFHVRRDEGVANGERAWALFDRNGNNNSTDPAFVWGYRADGTNPTRVYFGAGNNFPLDIRVSGAAQAISILNDGKVGIGNTAPSQPLDVAGRIRTVYGGFEALWGDNHPNGTFGVTAYNKDFGIRTQNGGDAMLTVKTDGKIGIGTVAPAAYLHVVKDFVNTTPLVQIQGNANGNNALKVLTLTHGNSPNGGQVGQALDIDFTLGGPSNAQYSAGQIRVGKQSDFTTVTNIDSYMAFRTADDGNFEEKMRITAEGNIGIGTGSAAPLGKVHVQKDGWTSDMIRVQGNANGNNPLRALALRHGNTPGPTQVGQVVDIDFSMERGDNNLQADAARIRAGKESDFMNAANTDSYLAFYTTRDGNFQERMRLKSDGELNVQGTIKVTGTANVGSIVTKTWTVAPDYVFDKGYKLRSLDEVDAFVRKNKHLPEVPSAKEFKEKGMDLAEMNFALLKKVEELTLHAIRQEKEMKRQAEEIKALKARP